MHVSIGEMSKDEQIYIKRNACPGCGACQYMGTASTMQCMAEALGMALPGAALAPAGSNLMLSLARNAADCMKVLIDKDIKPSDILTKEAFINAIRVHAAIGGSTNAVLHLPAVAEELGIEIKLEDFDRYTNDIPLLTSIMTAGKWPTQYFWYAGGIPRIMKELANKGFINTDLLTVTGKTIGENLDILEKCRNSFPPLNISQYQVIILNI